MQYKYHHFFASPITMAIVAIAVVVCTMVSNAQSKPPQTLNNAIGSPRGIYVVCGMDIPFPSAAVQSYIVERRPVNQGVAWQEYAELRAPSNLPEFRTRLQEALRDAPEPVSFTAIPTEELWKRAERWKVMDSLGMWQSSMPVRRALGTALLDSIVPRMVAYQYRISAKTATGRTTPIISNDAIYPLQPNFEPLRYSARQGEPNIITVTWSASRNIGSERQVPRSFFALRREAWKGGFVKIPVERSAHSSKDSLFYILRDTSVQEGALYQYCLVPFDMVGNIGTASDTVLAAAFDMRRLPLPDSIVIDNASIIGDVGLRLRWRLLYPENVAAIEIWRGTALNGTFQKIATVHPTQQHFTDHTPSPMQEYWYYLVARGVMGDVFPNSVRIPALFSNPQPPLPPRIIEAIGTPQGVRFAIRSPEPIRNFRVFRRDERGEFTLISPAIPVQDSLTIFEDTSSVLSGAKAYSYIIRSESLSFVESRNSDTVIVRPAKPVSAPLAPLLVRAIPTRTNRDSSAKPAIRLLWTEAEEEPANLFGYRIWRREANSSVSLAIVQDSLNAEVNLFIDSTITSGKLYEYAVQSIGFLNNVTSPLSMRAQASVLNPSFTVVVPQGLRASPDKGGSIRIQWDELIQYNSLTKLKLYRYERGEKPKMIAILEPQSQEYIDTTAQNKRLYFYYLIAVGKEQNESKPSTEVSIRIVK